MTSNYLALKYYDGNSSTLFGHKALYKGGEMSLEEFSKTIRMIQSVSTLIERKTSNENNYDLVRSSFLNKLDTLIMNNPFTKYIYVDYSVNNVHNNFLFERKKNGKEI